jgi:hypothetical protein
MALHLKSTGIDFADYSDNAGMASELLDDYEEGTWSPTTTAVTNILAISAGYVKVGRTVDLHIRINNNVGDVVYSDMQIHRSTNFYISGAYGKYISYGGCSWTPSPFFIIIQ